MSQDPAKTLAGCIGTVIAGFFILSTPIFIVAAITEKNSWYLFFVPLLLVIAFGVYKGFTRE